MDNQKNAALSPDPKEKIVAMVVQESAHLHEKEQLKLLVQIQSAFANRIATVIHDATSDYKMMSSRLDMLGGVQEGIESGLKISSEIMRAQEERSVQEKQPVPDLYTRT